MELSLQQSEINVMIESCLISFEDINFSIRNRRDRLDLIDLHSYYFDRLEEEQSEFSHFVVEPINNIVKLIHINFIKNELDQVKLSANVWQITKNCYTMFKRCHDEICDELLGNAGPETAEIWALYPGHSELGEGFTMFSFNLEQLESDDLISSANTSAHYRAEATLIFRHVIFKTLEVSSRFRSDDDEYGGNGFDRPSWHFYQNFIADGRVYRDITKGNQVINSRGRGR